MDRKLATIFASDVVGFSKMMGTDEVNTLKILKERRAVIDSIIDDHDGIIFGSAGDCEKALSELKRAMRLDPFSHDVLFAQEGMCYYWLEDYKNAVESFRKVKILRQNLFYLAACYIKMGDLDNGSEKLKEAESVTGQNSDAFVDSLPYEQKDMISDLRNALNSAKG